MLEALLSLYNKTRDVAMAPDDVFIDQIEELIELREQIIRELSLKPSIADEEKVYIRQISEFDNKVNMRMTHLRDEASKELRIINNTRKQKSGYDLHQPNESYFIDYKN